MFCYPGPKAEECPCEIFKVVGSGGVAKLSMGGEYQKTYNSSGNRLGTKGAGFHHFFIFHF